MSVNSRLSRKEFKFRQEKKRKQVIKKCDALYDEIRRNGYKSIPFPAPVFIGWTRSHVVREDILNSPDGEWASKILPLISQDQFSRRKDFKYKSSKKKILDIPHDLVHIEEWRWNKLKLDEEFPARIKDLFEFVQNKYKRFEYRFKRPWWFESQIKRTYATHYREFIGGALRSELDKIRDKIHQGNYWSKESGRRESPSDWMLKKFKVTHCDGKYKKIKIEE